MFNKLKKKIEEKEGEELPKLIASSSISNLLERRSSTNSLISGPPSHHTSVNSLVDPLQTLNEESETNKAQVDKEYKHKIDELAHQIRKLKTSLEKQQDASLRRMEVKEMEWKKELQRRESEWQEQIQRITREKEVIEEEKREVIHQKLGLEESLKSAENYREHLVSVHEDMEQHEGLQIQELAKVKHLLLNSQEDIKEREAVIAIKDENNSELQKRIDSLQADVERLREMENGMNNLQDEHDALKHSFELQRQKSQSLLEEKETEGKHLNELINTMKRQQDDQKSLEGDERVTALLAERLSLEQKLEELRQHLHEIKMTWSERISALEKQISHLNEKMAEDGTELRRVESEAIEVKEKLESKINEIQILKTEQLQQVKDFQLQKQNLEEQLANTTRNISEMQDKLHGKVQELNNAESQMKTNTELFKNKLEDLKKQVSEGYREKSHLETMLQQVEESKKDLQCTLDKKVEEITTMKSNNDRLEEELITKTSEKHEMEWKLEEQMGWNEKVTSKVEQLENDYTILKLNSDSDKQLIQDSLCNAKSELANDRDRFTKQFNSVSEQYSALKSERDTLLLRNADLSQEMELQKLSLNQRDSELNQRDSELNEQTSKVSELEREVSTIRETLVQYEEKKRDEESEIVSQLRSNVANLEDQLVEKNKTTKLLQQRISDMKKTIHKDFKVQKENHDLFGIPEQSPNNSINHDLNDSLTNDVPGINKEYLKHVIMKFLTSRESEAISLTKAVGTLLNCTQEEERLLRETLEWKMSWFGARPNLGEGQNAKTIPPTS